MCSRVVKPTRATVICGQATTKRSAASVGVSPARGQEGQLVFVLRDDAAAERVHRHDAAAAV